MTNGKCLPPADVAVVADPEAPGFVDPFLSVINTDAWAAGDLRGSYFLELLQPNAIPKSVGFVQFAIDTHCETKFSRTIREVVVGMRLTTLAH